MALGGFWCIWASMLVFEIRTFIVAGVATQWYYSPIDATISAYASLKRSAGHAFGASCGSLCLGSLVLTWVQILRNMANQTRQNRNIISVLLGCILQCISELIEFLTKFATIRCSITGEGFCEAGRNATDILKRNFLNTVGVWYFPQLVLGFMSFTVSVVWAMLMFVVAKKPFDDAAKATNSDDVAALVMSERVILAILAFLIVAIVVSFFASLLLAVVDAIYMCYAMDKDQNAIVHVEIHEVFDAIPSTKAGTLVANPDGEIGYGAPQDAQATAQYRPPSSSA